MGIQINGQNDTITAIDGSITVGTDLTVPGVLTYEDVTNIDSVGLITARSGIHVTSGSVGIGTDNPTERLHIIGGSGQNVGTQVDIMRLVASDSVPINSGGLTIGAVWHNTNVSQRIAYLQSSQNIDSGSTARGLVLNPNGGNVGIGTEIPGAKLEVATSVDGEATLATFKNTSSGIDQTVDIKLGLESLISSNVILRAGKEANHNSGAATDNFFAIHTTLDNVSSEKLRIDSAGRLGIGNMSPTALLDVSGSEPIFWMRDTSAYGDGEGPALYFNALDSGSVDRNIARIIAGASGSNSGILSFQTRLSGTVAERARLDSSGRLLLGTSTSREFGAGTSGGTAESQLQIEGEGLGESSISLARNDNNAGSARFFFGKSRGTTNGSNTIVQDDDKLGEIIFEGADGSKLVQAAWITAEVDGTPGADDMPGRLVFSSTAGGSSTPTERMRITSNGQTYWNTDTPGISSFGTSIGRAGNPGLFDSFRNVTGGSVVANIGGSVGYARIMGDGDLENSNNRYTGISDIKLKQNIEDANSQWDDIKGIRVRKYEFIANPDRKHIGVVAQELEEICPGLVIERIQNEETEETVKSVAYSVLYMKAVKALQEAMERIEQLETRLTALEAQ